MPITGTINMLSIKCRYLMISRSKILSENGRYTLDYILTFLLNDYIDVDMNLGSNSVISFITICGSSSHYLGYHN